MSKSTYRETGQGFTLLLVLIVIFAGIASLLVVLSIFAPGVLTYSYGQA